MEFFYPKYKFIFNNLVNVSNYCTIGWIQKASGFKNFQATMKKLLSFAPQNKHTKFEHHQNF